MSLTISLVRSIKQCWCERKTVHIPRYSFVLDRLTAIDGMDTLVRGFSIHQQSSRLRKKLL
ncbi:hypothetical protein Plhal710r2_c011g0050991 [Plasmopara halstedii]